MSYMFDNCINLTILKILISSENFQKPQSTHLVTVNDNIKYGNNDNANDDNDFQKKMINFDTSNVKYMNLSLIHI